MTAPSGMLGRYQIVKHLANGGMAQVLLAVATGIENFSRHVVVKRIHKERAADPQFVKMFLDEARLAAALHHNNIVQVHDIGQEDGEYFFAMEYVHGEDLRRLLMEVSKRKEKVPIEHVVTVVMDAAAALHYAHEMRGPDRKPLQLVHRDVSPANILVGYDGNVKVVDFGIAKAASLRTTETQGGTLKGKVSYMAPEQCAGKAVDRRSDVYALGIVLYELSTVRRLFKGDNDFLTMSAIVQGNIPKPSKHRPDIPAELEQIIMKALSMVPADRYQSANEMRTALDKFAAKHGLRTSTSGLADYMKSLFGEKPEPWLTDTDEPEMELTVDFDGSASGIAGVPQNVEEALAIPQMMETTDSAPIVRARTKAITNSPNPGGTIRMTPPAPKPVSGPLGRPTPPPMPVRRATPPAGVAVLASGDAAQVALPPRAITASQIAETTGWGATDATPTSASGTAMSWPSGTDATVNPAHARTRMMVIAGGVAIVSLIAILVFALRGNGAAPKTSPAVPAKVEPAKLEPSKVEPPKVEPPKVEPPKVENAGTGSAEPITPPNLEGSGSAIAETGSGSAAGAGSGSGASDKKKKRRPVKQTWTPDELFPK